MWNAESSSSGQLSEYERQRLENIAQMNEQFNDLFENVSKSALDLAEATSSSAGINSNKSVNGRKRTRNSQQFRQVKIFSKGREKPHSHPIRRSKRINNDKRKRPEYDERSDNDDEKPSKALRLKFPFFKKNEFAQRDEDYYKELDDADFIDSDDDPMEYDDSSYRSKRRHKVSMNAHQVPVSLITQEMLKNITYSSCGKSYDAVKGTTCHQCRQKTLDQKSYCRYKKCRGIRGMFCGFCLGKRYGEDVAEVLLNKKWACPPCRGYCNCSICRRKEGRPPTGQLSQIAEAGGYKSVKHMLETTEGGVPEKDLSSDYDSDENDKKGGQEDGISESINDLNEEDIKTEQNDSLIKTKNINVSNDMNGYSNSEKQCSLDILETAEAGVPEKDLSSDEDSDKDNKKNDQENGISQSINNNLNDGEIQFSDVIFKKRPKTENSNEEAIKTDQNNSLVKTENKIVSDSVNCFKESEGHSLDMCTSGEMILNKLYQQLYCCS